MFSKKMVMIAMLMLGSLSAEVITHYGVTYGTVVSPITGRIWLDRNLGATKICSHVTGGDDGCYGWLYQWGRGNDGHQNLDSAVVDYDNKNYIENRFIKWTLDWEKDTDPEGVTREKRWKSTDGTSICPIGFYVPSSQDVNDESRSWGEYPSFFNNTMDGGYRGWHAVVTSSYSHICWTSTPNFGDTAATYDSYTFFALENHHYKQVGYFVRCIKSRQLDTSNFDKIAAPFSLVYA